MRLGAGARAGLVQAGSDRSLQMERWVWCLFLKESPFWPVLSEATGKAVFLGGTSKKADVGVSEKNGFRDPRLPFGWFQNPDSFPGCQSFGADLHLQAREGGMQGRSSEILRSHTMLHMQSTRVSYQRFQRGRSEMVCSL